jgi:hypothetical protein
MKDCKQKTLGVDELHCVALPPYTRHPQHSCAVRKYEGEVTCAGAISSCLTLNGHDMCGGKATFSTVILKNV